MPVVVCGLGGEAAPWELPASVPSGRTWIHGGERSLYEVAIAIAAGGRDVELRGEVHVAELDALCRAAGARPRTGMGPRAPAEDDVVVVPEGYPDPQAYARISLSPARGVILVLAAPGLFGWPFVEGWTPPDPLDVPLDDVARPEHFRGMAAAGFELWTNSRAMRTAAADAGVDCVYVGQGVPTPFPEVLAKSVDVVTVSDNRWAPLAEKIVAGLSRPHRAIPRLGREDFLGALGEGRILVLPSRIEGASRIQIEARAMGTVPVALASNRFADGLDEDHGAVPVGSLDEMPSVVESLLDDPGRLEELSARAIRTAREQVDWQALRVRIEEALAKPRPAPGRAQREGAWTDAEARERRFQAERWAMADRVRKVEFESEGHRREAERLLFELERAAGHVRELQGRIEELDSAVKDRDDRIARQAGELASVRDEAEQARERLAGRERELSDLRSTRTFRYTARLRAIYERLRRPGRGGA
jgi:hypothetical protein